MINKISFRLAEKLLSNGSITENERELYIYSFFILLTQTLYFALACFFGVIFGCFGESLIFFTAFMFIRKYAGGYHAKTETRCEILSALSIAGCIWLIKMSKNCNLFTILLCAALICAVVIITSAPLDTPEKPLSKKEFDRFKLITRIILTVILILITVSFYFNIQFLFVPCSVSLILEGILLISGRIKKYIQSHI